MLLLRWVIIVAVGVVAIRCLWAIVKSVFLTRSARKIFEKKLKK
jgi:hypothetical protein